MQKHLALAVLACVLGACDAHRDTDHEVGKAVAEAAEGARYKQALIALVQRANKIVVTEHSSPFDFHDANGERPETEKTLIYGTHELSKTQMEFFLSTVQAMDPKTQDAFNACVPAFHHTITFYIDEKLIETMNICFECGQVDWSGAEVTPPWSIYSTLAKVVEAAGFKSERAWGALAQVGAK